MTQPEKDEAQTRLIGCLPDDVPEQEMIALTDSILASPILTVIVDNKTKNGNMMVKTLEDRGGDLLEVVALNGRNPLSLYPGYVENPETAEDAELFLEHGVPGILFSLWLDDGQTMSETIARAREFREVILEAFADEYE
ncbi:MAG: hypothetical protein AAGD96_16595 [Chloroflexota bacterium]